MTTHEAFTPEEWRTVLEGPPAAGMIVVTASGGGMFKETFAMSKAYAEARAGHGQSELLDEIVAAKPKVDHPKAGSQEEFRELSLQHLRAAVALVQANDARRGGGVPPLRPGRRGPGRRRAPRGRPDREPGEAEAIARIAEAVGAKSA